jgi:hypothetical protein
MKMVATNKTTSIFLINIWCAWPQIVVKADELFSGVLTYLGEIIDYNPDDEDPILTIFDYVEVMRCQLRKIALFIELGGDNDAHMNNPPGQAMEVWETLRLELRQRENVREVGWSPSVRC